MPLSKTHIALSVGDTGQSAAFYEALLGGPPLRRSAGLAVFELESPPLLLTVEDRPLRRSKPRPPVSFVLAVAEPQHVGDAAIRLRRAGFRLRVEDRGIEAQDPDGNAWRVSFVSSAHGPAVMPP